MDQVDLYQLALDVPMGRLRPLASCLSPDELVRAERFRRPQDRERFISARGQLREILGGWVGEEPAALRFRYGINGKPFLARPGGPLFSISHSGPLAIVATTQVGDIGVDIERTAADLEMAAADVVFSPLEAQAVRSMGSSDQLAAFYRCWTRKESLLKARGEGLSVDPRRLSVFRGEPGPLQVSYGERVWTILDLPVAAPYCAAVAVEGSRSLSVVRHA